MIDPSRYFLILFSLLVMTGCSGLGTASESNRGEDPGFEKIITPFEVYDSTGSILEHPFLGGFNAPRPQFVDIDGDGDSDLFIQENSNEVMFFEQTSSGSSSELRWQSDNFRDLDIGEWYRFVDIDQDGDMDLLAEQPYSYIRLYKNVGNENDPHFELAADTLQDVNGEPIFSDRQNIPNVTDIDCDNKLDLFIGRLDGTITRYESVGRDSQGIPQFELVSKRFEGIEIVKQIGSMHGANTLTFEDIDGDGDQDLFWGDFFEPSLLQIENRGSCESPELEGEPQPFPANNPVESSGYNAPVFTDWGNDGDQDLLIGVLGGAYNANQTLAENLYFYEQDESDNFRLQTKKFLNGIDIGNESIPAAGDIDGDGDTDLLLANKIDPGDRNTSVVYIYENRGFQNEPKLHQDGSLDLPNGYHYAPALGDLNGDGLADLLLGNWKGVVSYYQNTGDGFELVDEAIVELERGSNSTPELADIDNDSDLDLVVGSSGGAVYYYRNEGSSDEPTFVFQEDRFTDIEVGHRSVPELYDFDGDGDLDLFVGSKSDGMQFYRNEGIPENPSFKQESLPVSIEVPRLAAPDFVNVDKSGPADFISGGREGGIIYYKWME